MDKLLFDTVWASYTEDGELHKLLIREDWYDRLEYLWSGKQDGQVFDDLGDGYFGERWENLDLGVDADGTSVVFMVMAVKAAARRGLSIGKWRKELQTVYGSGDGDEETMYVVPQPVEVSG